jgi:serine/threonine-protein kinase
MANTNWRRLEDLFENARDLPIAARDSFLDAECIGSPLLRAEVQAMLSAFGAGPGLAIERFVVDVEPREEDLPDPWIGERLGPWRLTRHVGRGGMGLVYGAQRADGQYHLEVAVKLLRAGPRDPYAFERFATERQVLASLKHPNIAGLLDSGFTRDRTPYLIMELVDGVPITEWCASEKLPLAERLRLFRIVCDAVQHAHRALVVHRDLKPSNIFVSKCGDVKLLDFGIAKLLEPEAWGFTRGETRLEMRPLTPDYAAPEQRRGEAVTTATDVYALGVLVYELVTGVRPASPDAGKRNAIDAPSDVVSCTAGKRDARRVRGDLDRIIMTALRDEPERRYASAGQLGEEVGRFLEGRAVLAQPDTLSYRARKFVRRNPVPVAMAAGLMLSLATFGGVSAWQARVLEGQRRVAQQERDTANQVVRVLIDLFETTNPAIRPNGDRMPVGEFLAGAQARSLEALRDVPLVRAKLEHVFGMIHYTRGQYAPAKQALEAALAESRKLSGPDAPESLETLQALGELSHFGADDERARALLEESLQRHTRVYGEHDARTARVLHSLAAVVEPRSMDESGELLRRSLQIRLETLGPMHRDVAESYAALAAHYTLRHDVQRARGMYLEALKVYPRPQDRRDPRAITLLNDYATFLEDMNEYPEAQVLQREAIAIARDVLGAETFPVANLLSNIGVTQAAMGAHVEAEASFRAAFESMRALLGDDHWNTRNVARNVGRVLQLQGRYSEALAWMDRAVSSPNGLESGNWSIRAQRAALLFRVGRHDEALTEATAAVNAIALMGEDTRGALAIARVMLGRILTDSGRPRDAVAPLRAAVEWYDTGPNNGWRAEASCEYARARLLSGGTREDWDRLQQYLPIYRNWGVVDREVLASLERLQLRESDDVRFPPIAEERSR